MFEQLNTRIQPVIAWLNEQRHLQALKMSLVHVVPFFVGAGVIGLFQVAMKLDDNYNIGLMLLRFLPLFVAYDIGAQLCENKKFPAFQGGMLVLTVCLLTGVNNFIEDPLSVYFPWIILSLVIGEIYCCLTQFKFTIPNMPSAVSDYLMQVLPFIITLLIGLLCAYTAPSWMQCLNTIAFYIVGLFDHIILVIILVILTCLFWILGLHGVASIATVVRPFWMYMLMANGIAFFMGQPIPYIASEGFYQWFIWIGGSGATLGLVIIMRLLAKSTQLQQLSRQTLNGSFFNINEMIIFGAPIVKNPIMMIPFIVAPICAALLNYWFVQAGFLNPVVISMPWVFPGPIGAFFASGFQWNAVLSCLCSILISCIIYLPFFFIYDRRLSQKGNTSCDV